MKKIVIGLMDRLASFAQRESEAESLDDRKKAEEEATSRMLEKLRLVDEKKSDEPKKTVTEDAHPNGTKADAATSEADGSTTEAENETTAIATPKSDDKTSAMDVPLYEIFYKQVIDLVKNRGLSIQDTMALLVSLVNLALNIYPDRLEYVDQILSYASEKTAEYADSADLHSAAAQSNMLNLLLAPVKSYHSLFTALALPHYVSLFSAQTYATRRSVAGEFARTILRNRTIISSSEHLEGVLSILRVLIKEGIQQPSGYSGLQTRQRSGETDETIEEQGWLARMVHQIKGPDNDTHLKVCHEEPKSSSEIGS